MTAIAERPLAATIRSVHDAAVNDATVLYAAKVTLSEAYTASPVGSPPPKSGSSWRSGRHQPRGPVRRWARTHPADIIDVFVYVVVLNLAVEYLPAVISEGFTLSLLTALLLKLALEVVLWINAHIIVRLRAAKSRPVKVAIALTLWVVAAGSKFVVLKLVELVFGDSVSLGGFLPVTALVVTLLFARGAVRRLLDISL